jgi:hypothetical protein
VTGERVYIHEFIDIIGQSRAKYMQHMTANWCPIGWEERRQKVFGVWGTVGSTGRWPEVVNLWEYEHWDSLGQSFDLERSSPSLQDPSLEEWWAAAAPLRRGGIDRILVSTPWSRSIDQLVADGVRGAFYAHELVTVPLGGADEYLSRLRSIGLPCVQDLGLELCSAFRVALADETECIVIWAIPDWRTWVGFEQAWSPDGALAPWRKAMLEMGAGVRRTLLMDSPLNPMRTGRQPQVSDRRPLSDF